MVSRSQVKSLQVMLSIKHDYLITTLSFIILSRTHSYSDSHPSAFSFFSSNLRVLGSIRANVRKVARGKIGIRVVVPEESLHLGGLVDNCHHGEVVGVVPSPRDAEGSFLSSFSI